MGATIAGSRHRRRFGTCRRDPSAIRESPESYTHSADLVTLPPWLTVSGVPGEYNNGNRSLTARIRPAGAAPVCRSRSRGRRRSPLDLFRILRPMRLLVVGPSEHGDQAG